MVHSFRHLLTKVTKDLKTTHTHNYGFADKFLYSWGGGVTTSPLLSNTADYHVDKYGTNHRQTCLILVLFSICANPVFCMLWSQ